MYDTASRISTGHHVRSRAILRCRNRAGGDPRRPHDRGHRRRRPRKRRRPHHGGREDHARSHQLHGQVRARSGLPRHDRGAAGLSSPGPDVGGEHLQLRHRLHRIHRRQGRRHHRHLGVRSRRNHSRRHRSLHPAQRSGASRTRLSAARAQRRRAGSRRTDRSLGRSRAAGRHGSGGRDLRDHERRRHHGARAAAHRVLPPARPEDADRRRTHPLSHGARALRAAAGRDRCAHRSMASSA